MGGTPKVDNSASEAAARAAETARLEEEQRQQRLKFGQTQIDAIFGGGTAFDTVEGFLADQEAAAKEKERTGDLSRLPDLGPFADFVNFSDSKDSSAEEFPTTTFPGFDPLVERRRQAGLDVGLPQLEKRFGDARSGLAFNLSRAGLSNSSQAAGRQADLGETFQLQDANIRAGVEGDVTSLRSRIALAKTDAELQLRATSDPSAAVNTALSSRTRFADEQPSGFTLGDVFATVLSGIGQGVNTFQSNRTAETLSRLLSSSTATGSGRLVA